MASFSGTEELDNSDAMEIASDANAVEEQVNLCDQCQVVAMFACSRCTAAHYCSQACQKLAWKLHKKICSPPVVAGSGRCLRCELPCEGRCRVPHPISARQELTTTYLPGGPITNECLCTACGNSFKLTKENSKQREWVHSTGAQYCFEGKHTTSALDPADKRVIRAGEVSLSGSADEVQIQLDLLKQEGKLDAITTLVINGDYSERQKLSFKGFVLPALKCFKMFAIECSALELTPETTPLLEELYLENMGDLDEAETQFNVIVPNVKMLTVQYLTALESEQTEMFNAMLQSACKLVRFDGYKARVSEMHFVSNYLQEVKLVRSECMTHVSLWAPRLKILYLAACYDLYDIEVLEDHALRSRLPADFQMSKFSADITNCCERDALHGCLNEIPRCKKVVDETQY